MKREEQNQNGISRRNLLRSMVAGAALAATGVKPLQSSLAQATEAKSLQRNDKPYNILFILTDQERYFQPGELPQGYSLPGHERLAKQGMVFENHRINSCVCTPSRSVLYTGQHIQHTKMFDNTNFPWISSMSPDIKTVGHLLRDAGYYTAYKGKWHLTKEFETVNELGSPTKIFTKEMEAYGFADYFGVGDIIAHTQGGYLHDGIISAMAVNWLRSHGADLSAQGKPWFLTVNLVNPHDVMYYNTDRPGERVQENNILSHIAPDPKNPLYAKQWEFNLPPTFSQSINVTGRPAAHTDYIQSHDALVGRIDPKEEWRWRKRHNYYLNCLRDVDRNITAILDDLEALGLSSNTIVMLTADHGDLDGAHQLHAKGATSYREQNNVPFIIAHPAFPGGTRCKAVTSHLDIAPTLVNLTNAPAEKKAEITKNLKGKDFSGLLKKPDGSIRDGQLFCYNMFAYIDGPFLAKAAQFLMAPGGKEKIQEMGIKPDLMKRGAIRSIFDGRYQFSRYFSPKQHNLPKSIEEILQYNDVELFDLQTDPQEMNNLALNAKQNGDLLLAMNAKLTKLIEEEVGEDVGQMLPGGVDGGWVVTPAAKDL